MTIARRRPTQPHPLGAVTRREAGSRRRGAGPAEATFQLEMEAGRDRAGLTERLSNVCLRGGAGGETDGEEELARVREVPAQSASEFTEWVSVLRLELWK